jgi:hypothetical protein
MSLNSSWWRRLCVFAAIAMLLSVSALPALANLAGSPFEGNDGNLNVDTAGNTDWANVAGLNAGIDLPSGSGDNSFGQGTNEDDPNVVTVSGSIPPNKNDLTRFYEASQVIGTDTYLYLAWERLVNIGNANMDFEINQATTPNLGVAGAHTIVRTAGDLLVNYDFPGSGSPVLSLNTWLTAGHGDSASDCFKAHGLPCWGKHVTLSGTNSEGAVNTGNVVDPIAPNAPRTLGTGLFGEAAINLTGAGVFPPGVCEAFGSTFLKSRSSSSFTAEIKDFIAPIPVNISNCGTIKIIKHTDPRGINQNFSYTSTIPATSTCTSDTTPASFTLNDSAGVDGSSNTESCTNVPAGSYTVTEGSDPANFVFQDLSCTATGTGTSATPSSGNATRVASITIAGGGVVTCTYTNKQQLGAIKVTKTRKHAADGTGDHPHSGVSFTVNGVTKQTDANGVACFDGLAFGSYTVHETVPTGYHVDANDKSVTVDNSASCSDSTYVGETVSFHNTPLTDITVTVNSQVDGGTSSTITCVKSSDNSTVASGSTGATGDGSATASNLEPDTYTCTVVVDP